jgi:exopolyphosphatase/pppGpp-phosphohydrolase
VIVAVVDQAANGEELVAVLSEATQAPVIAELHGITPERAHTLLGGTLVLAATARRLRTDLGVGRGGLREGAALALARAAAAAA